ncbi:chaplin [Streptomyces sp. 8N616]|uniref:chaplin n=1 Tax=Streptomyces sp. 8N616 TaxID=3457414 RepID=UPI003FD2C7E4
MRQVARKSLITVAAASGVLAVTGGYAYADADAGAISGNSPGIGSGNTVQVPVHVPVNLCGNTVNAVGLFNPANGNSCANVSGGGHESGGNDDSSARAGSGNSGGVVSGNIVQVPIDVPINACGNSVNEIGVGNATIGNKCANVSQGTPGYPHEPERPHDPDRPNNPDKPDDEDKGKDKGKGKGNGQVKPGHEDDSEVKPAVEHRPQAVTAPEGDEELAETGAGMLGAAGATSAALLLGGAVLYRRSRAASRS